MAGISSDSLATALAELEPRLTGATPALAQELFEVLSVLDSSAGLRRALTDPARPAADKLGLLSSLLKGKVSAEAESIVSSLVAERWSDARSLGDALERVAATVAIAVAENAAQSKGLEELERTLFEFSQVVGSNHEVQRALTSPEATAEAKRTLALKLVPGAGEAATVLISQAVTSPRGLQPAKLVDRFAALAAARQNRWIAAVSTSRPLSAEQQTRLKAGLDRLYGRELNLNASVDPSLIGGIRVRVGDEVVDASLVTRLGELHRQLVG
ncbi:F0F1 ATP synthase subunit delta [Psychromicrobium xiongbiense]|uniref:F0F1 ATP synthase subunit delta n=1 Tax=Psychromicrobium xiongbiense TaxID=3051184 RepID=UPI0025525301|nr:F0F1 ATP synthase subunit delta [Psychromicrobium sp. YIM S02556]